MKKIEKMGERKKESHKMKLYLLMLFKVPGLLFFLESTKAQTSKSMRGEAKKDRRKSISLGSGKTILKSPDDLNSVDVCVVRVEESGRWGSPYI
jgi:hypothetical protein